MEEKQSPGMSNFESIQIVEKPNCLLCGNNGSIIYTEQMDRIFHAPGSWSLMRCEECDFIWLQPQPVANDIWKLYETYHTHSIEGRYHYYTNLLNRIKDSILTTHMGYSDLVSSSILKAIGRIFCWVGPIRENAEFSAGFLHGQERGRLLDVGCGAGRFLNKMRSLKWEVMGVETDKQAALVAREHFDLNVHVGTVQEAQFADNEFDAISMHHVIEHVDNPIEILKECLRVLKVGGRLVIITPNLRSFGHRLFHDSWRGLEVPRHLQIFSPKSLKKCADQAGFRTVRVKTIAQLSRYIWVTSRLIRKNSNIENSTKNQGIGLRVEGFIFWLLEYAVSRWKNVGEEIVLVGKK